MAIVDIRRHRLDDPADWARCAERVGSYLAKHLTRYDDLGVALVTCTITQPRNKLNDETRVLRSAEEEFEQAHADRSVHTQEFDDGMGRLAVTGSVDAVRLARAERPDLDWEYAVSRSTTSATGSA